MKPFWLLALSLAVLAPPSPALAWGSKGHRMIGVLAAQRFPAAIPGFLRTPDAVFRIGELAREPDRSRGAGQPHDGDRDPAHFIDLNDDGTMLTGSALTALPATRQDYDTALRAAGSNQYKAGWLSYALMDGWEQLVQDFALWRADAAGAKFAKTAAVRAWFIHDRHARESTTLRDLGVWAHFVGDAGQPMHVSVHYNGWGDFPNPENFASTNDFHSRFETVFVNTSIDQNDVRTLLQPYRDCACAIQVHAATYLADTQKELITAFRLDQAGAFDQATPQAKVFVATRLAAAADMLRDMVVDAWKASANVQLGYKPSYPLSDIEAGKVNAYPLLHD